MAEAAHEAIRANKNNPILATDLEARERPGVVRFRIRIMNGKDRRHHELMAKLDEILRQLQLLRSPRQEPFNLQKQYTQQPLTSHDDAAKAMRAQVEAFVGTPVPARPTKPPAAE